MCESFADKFGGHTWSNPEKFAKIVDAVVGKLASLRVWAFDETIVSRHALLLLLDLQASCETPWPTLTQSLGMHVWKHGKKHSKFGGGKVTLPWVVDLSPIPINLLSSVSSYRTACWRGSSILPVVELYYRTTICGKDVSQTTARIAQEIVDSDCRSIRKV